MKKFLSLALAVAMVLSMAVTAFAADKLVFQSDKAPTEVEASNLDALYAAGVIKGEGGKAPSANATLTRWQVALLALRVYTMLDNEEPGAAAYDCDLDDSNWANYVVDFGDKTVKYEDCEYPSALGAILFVQEKGFILGYAEDDKTYFRPAQPVTYAEALTIMVRILGWDSPAMNTNWPYNYVEQAAKLGLTADISKVGMDDQVTYGVFATLIINALNSKRYIPADKYNEFGHEEGAVGLYGLNDLATSTLIFGYLDAEGKFVQVMAKNNKEVKDHARMGVDMQNDNNPTVSFTLLNNVGKIGNYLWAAPYDSDEEEWLLDEYQKTAGVDYDLFEMARHYDGSGWPKVGDVSSLSITRNYNLYVGGENIMKSTSSSWRVGTWFWYLYDFEYNADGSVKLDKNSRRIALTYDTNGASSPSANAWYNQKVAGNTAMVYEPMKEGEILVLVNVNGEYYFTHITDAKEEYNKAYDKKLAELKAGISEADYKDVLSDSDTLEIIETAANIYTRQCLYYGGSLGDPEAAMGSWKETHVNNFSVNYVIRMILGADSDMVLTAEDFAGILAKNGIVDDGGTAFDEEYEADPYDFETDALCEITGCEPLFVPGYDQSKLMLNLAKKYGTYDLAIEKAVQASFLAQARAAGQKAYDSAIQKSLKNTLASINTDVAGKEFLGWSGAYEQLQAPFYTNCAGKFVAVDPENYDDEAFEALYGISKDDCDEKHANVRYSGSQKKWIVDPDEPVFCNSIDAKAICAAAQKYADDLNAYAKACDYYYDGKVLAINALYEEDSTKVEWTGEENALGSYVTETTVKDGFKKVTEYAHGLVKLADLDATTLSKTAKFIGEKSGATYGAWLIDTNGDGLYDVVIYANFVTGE